MGGGERPSEETLLGGRLPLGVTVTSELLLFGMVLVGLLPNAEESDRPL